MTKHLFGIVSAVIFSTLASPLAHAIINGQPDGDRHPYVGLLVFDDAEGPAWRCSGTLLSPTVVLTAGHCTDGAVAARAWFDERVQGNPEYPFGGTTSYEGTPHTSPDFCIGCGGGLPGFDYRDVGIVVLSEPVPTSVVDTYGELPEAGLVDALANKTPLDIVGYGVQEQIRGDGPPMWTGVVARLSARAELVAGDFVHSDEFIRLTQNHGRGKGGTCFGDSGGPDLLGGTDTILAVNSYLTNMNCAGVSYSSRIDIPEVLEWIEGFLE